MISSSLFRPNDVVHYRDDLRASIHYPMLYDTSIDCTVSRDVEQYRGDAAHIADTVYLGRYRVGVWMGWSDTCFREGARIGKFLKTEGGIVS